jgi:hypothetical protein
MTFLLHISIYRFASWRSFNSLKNGTPQGFKHKYCGTTQGFTIQIQWGNNRFHNTKYSVTTIGFTIQILWNNTRFYNIHVAELSAAPLLMLNSYLPEDEI